jgi:hypothetical protein
VWFKCNYKNWMQFFVALLALRFRQNVLRSTLSHANKTAKTCIKFLIEDAKTKMYLYCMLDIKYITWIHPGNFKNNSFVNFYDNQYICEIKFCKLTTGTWKRFVVVYLLLRSTAIKWEWQTISCIVAILM